MWLILLLLQAAEPRVPAPGHWPTHRGPNRDNISTETGLLQVWPEGGPPLLWSSTDAGDGVGGIAVAGGLIFMMGYRTDGEYLTALDGRGRRIWSTRLGPLVGEMPMMRWLSQRTPTVDDDRVYAFTADGVLHCLESTTGILRWSKNYASEFKARKGNWGWCDFPMVDGRLLICSPGGPAHALVALNKHSGDLEWSCALPGSFQNTYSPVVVAELAGRRQYLQQFHVGAVGVDPLDGTLLWSHPMASRMGQVYSLVPWGQDRVLVPSSWGQDTPLLGLSSQDGALLVAPIYQIRLSLDAWLGAALRFGDRVYYQYSGNLYFLNLPDGTKGKVDGIKLARFTATAAPGRMILRGNKGEVEWLRLEPEGPVRAGSFAETRNPNPVLRDDYPWTFPVIAGGRLYLRDQATLRCYAIAAPDAPPAPSPWNILSRVPDKLPDPNPGPAPKPLTDAAFVPTPLDVVDRMLDLAGTGKDDRVLDLGSGDGRIPLRAAVRHGCLAVGVENDPELVRASRARVAEAKQAERVTILDKDLFAHDLSDATVITLYLGEPNNARLLPKLRALKPGVRLVSHQHLLGPAGPPPDRTLRVTSTEDGVEHAVHLWTTPLK
jgi:outer membrane protein assembly factor BamB/SAM-dependent methyltransferase